MPENKFKQQIANCTAEAFKVILPELFREKADLYLFDSVRLYERIEVPKKPDMGNFALPLFEIAKQIRKNPVEVNKILTKAENKFVAEHEEYAHLSFSAAGGFNNGHFHRYSSLMRITVLPKKAKEKKSLSIFHLPISPSLLAWGI